MVKASIKIKDPQGLHLRPTSELCTEAGKYKSKIRLIFGNASRDAKSLLSVLSARVKCGSEITFVCEGPDEQEALDAMLFMVERSFSEEDSE